MKGRLKADCEYYDKVLSSATSASAFDSLKHIIKLNHKGTYLHLTVVGLYVKKFANILGFKNQSANILGNIAFLHDIGKISIPNAILDGTDPMTPKQRELMNEHPDAGYEILTLMDTQGCFIAATVAMQHHEWYSGEGYPAGIKGNNIGLGARITSIIDVFEALTAPRTYKKSWSFDDAMDYIRTNTGLQFDPLLVTVFTEHSDEFRQIYNYGMEKIYERHIN